MWGYHLMPDALTDATTSTFLGVPTLYIVIGLVGVIFLLIIYYKKKQPPKFKKLSAKEEIHQKYKELFKSMGSQKIGKILIWGMEKKGRIGKSIIKNWKELAENKESQEVYVFEVYNLQKAIGYIKYLLNFRPTYFIVPKDAITENFKEIIIDTTYKYDNIFGVIAFSKSGKQVVDDESYKVAHEQAINEMINWLPLQSYLSVQHAQSSEGLDHLAEIEKNKRDESISEMTGKKKK